ncbi:FAD/NAD(P)-binding domain-containing protein [Athelia psychrophila]|uniref:FAD/NAD(P)-binding domain-containing protein n=1 Tax=Athelia psychrophila TaxID=1759441 RepID=A0A166UBV7_9AGAM|nr:FAD/NAD(P)-binding domain-containing protein [Fibularhizoctonia sp. CBS 109695]
MSKNVVIIGGGFAGVSIARMLSPKLGALGYTLVLINARPFHVHLIAALRMTVSAVDRLEDHAILPFDNVFANGVGSVKIGSVASITDDGGGNGGVVHLAGGETVQYAFLVLAPGSTWHENLSLPDDKQMLTEHIAQWRRKFESAQDIVLAGGGAVGIEAAGEIKDIWPSKNVTIVHGGTMLMNDTYPAHFRAAVAAGLTARGISIVYSDRVVGPPKEHEHVSGTITTRNGASLDADLVLTTHAGGPNTAFVASLGPGALDARGYIVVAPTLQLPAHPAIYAAGDAIAWPETKAATKVQQQRGVVAANILSAIRRRPPTAVYKGGIELILLTNGKAGGAGYIDILWGIALTGSLGAWLASVFKSRHLAIPMARKLVGLS